MKQIGVRIVVNGGTRNQNQKLKTDNWQLTTDNRFQGTIAPRITTMSTPDTRMLARISLVLMFAAATTLAAEAGRPPVSATILCYHVVESPHDTMFAVDRSDFLQQVEYLVSTGYNIIPLSMLADYVAGKRDSLPDHAVVLTVDDGWRCTYTEIYPVLKRYHLPFTIFIYPSFIGQSAYALNWKQVREMAESGVDIQSHTYSHPFLTKRRHRELDAGSYVTWLQDELTQSRQAIEKETGRPVKYLAYPYGDYDTAVAAATAASGYELGLTCDFGTVHKGSDRFRMRRVMIYGKTSFSSFREHLGTAALLLAAENPRPGKVLDTDQQPVISATIANAESVDPSSVGMSILSLGKMPSFFDRKKGTVSMVLRDDLKGNRQRAVVWARDKATGKRLEATWSFYLTPPPPPPPPSMPPDLAEAKRREPAVGVTAPPAPAPLEVPPPGREPAVPTAEPSPANSPASDHGQSPPPRPSHGGHR
jgi:peptidoglycan/xylan/chitin deacetylase (PgdA/CDA1 family)